MSNNDSKALYSKAAQYYLENKEVDKVHYDKSMERKEKYGTLWEKAKVNINDIIDEFAPEFMAKEYNEKMIFYGEAYNVVTDMASGYLRIYDINAKMYVKLDGTPGKDSETHFKIKKREEMEV